MPGFFPGRPGGEHDEPLLDMILERRPIPPGAPPENHGLARMLAAVAGPAEPGDLVGQAAAQAAFTRLASPPGTSSAAYAAVLPSPIQHFAHAAFGAPPPPHDLALRVPPVTSSPTPTHSELSTSAPVRRQSAAPSESVSDKAHSGGFHLRKGNDTGPGQASCTTVQNNGQAVGHSQDPAQPSPTPNQVKPGSDQGQGGSGQARGTASPGYLSGVFSLPTTACPDGTTPAKATDAPE